jgi:hypothetical protein
MRTIIFFTARCGMAALCIYSKENNKTSLKKYAAENITTENNNSQQEA